MPVCRRVISGGYGSDSATTPAALYSPGMDPSDYLRETFRDLKHRRLWNWGRYRFHAWMADAPDSSCVNHIYQMGRADGDGYGDLEVEGNVALAPQPEPARAEYDEIDVEDAESLDFQIAQIEHGHQSVLRRVYVLRGRKGSPALLDAAIRAITGVQSETKRVHAAMRR